MNQFDPHFLTRLYVPAANSHKGQNGKLLIIAGSKLFHAASLWPLTVASKLLDMVFYSSVRENNQLVQNAKAEFRNGIVVSRNKLDHYIEEADCILIGPGLPRPEGKEELDDDTKQLTEDLLTRFPEKKWVIDGGSLQTIDPEVLLKLKTMPILTPHQGEFETLFKRVILGSEATPESKEDPGQARMTRVFEIARKYNSVILLKGPVDTVASPTQCISIPGGNPGMTKGGTGDVLAGLVASLYCKNDAFISACAGSYINKKAGEALEARVGLYFNASDLADEIPVVMKNLIP